MTGWPRALLLLALVSGCASSPDPESEYRPNPPVSASQRTELRVAVVELEDWNPPDDAGGPSWGLVPGVLWQTTGTRHRRAYVGRCLYVELRSSNGFAQVDYLASWPTEPGDLREYDLWISGRLLQDSVSKGVTAYGLSLLGMALLPLTGTPHWWSTRSLAFDLIASPASSPDEALLRRIVRVPDDRKWENLYNNTGDPRKSDWWAWFDACPSGELRPHFEAFRDDLLSLDSTEAR